MFCKWHPPCVRNERDSDDSLLFSDNRWNFQLGAKFYERNQFSLKELRNPEAIPLHSIALNKSFRETCSAWLIRYSIWLRQVSNDLRWKRDPIVWHEWARARPWKTVANRHEEHYDNYIYLFPYQGKYYSQQGDTDTRKLTSFRTLPTQYNNFALSDELIPLIFFL